MALTNQGGASPTLDAFADYWERLNGDTPIISAYDIRNFPCNRSSNRYYTVAYDPAKGTLTPHVLGKTVLRTSVRHSNDDDKQVENLKSALETTIRSHMKVLGTPGKHGEAYAKGLIRRVDVPGTHITKLLGRTADGPAGHRPIFMYAPEDDIREFFKLGTPKHFTQYMDSGNFLELMQRIDKGDLSPQIFDDFNLIDGLGSPSHVTEVAVAGRTLLAWLYIARAQNRLDLIKEAADKLNGQPTARLNLPGLHILEILGDAGIEMGVHLTSDFAFDRSAGLLTPGRFKHPIKLILLSNAETAHVRGDMIRDDMASAKLERVLSLNNVVRKKADIQVLMLPDDLKQARALCRIKRFLTKDAAQLTSVLTGLNNRRMLREMTPEQGEALMDVVTNKLEWHASYYHPLHYIVLSN